MLKQIVDKSKLEETDLIKNALEKDLERINLMNWKDKPYIANAIKVIPTNGMFMDSINYQFQYGFKIKSLFIPLSKLSGKKSHEGLPYFN